MALLFSDSFDHYATADILKKHAASVIVSGTNNVTIGAVGRNATNGARFTWATAVPNNVYIQSSPPVAASGATAIMGFAINVSGYDTVNGNQNGLAAFYNAGVIQTSLRIDAGGTLTVLRGPANGTVLGTSSATIPIGGFAFLEFKAVLSASATGSYQVNMNGIPILSGAAVQTALGAVWTTYRVGANQTNQPGTACTWDVDDLYIADGTGAQNNDFLGPIRVACRLPDAAGTYSQFTASPVVANYLNVDEALQDGDTTYNAETTAGEKDTYNFAALGIGGNVKGVQTNLMVRSNASGSEVMQPMFRIGGVDYFGANFGMGTAYTDKMQMYELSPATGLAWTVAEIDAAEMGIRLVS